MIQKVYQNQTGHAVDLSGVVLAVQAYATKQDVLAELSAASGSISSELKEEIIRPAYVMLLADNRLAGQERGMLKDSARLKISEIRLWAIVESIDPSSAKDSSPRGAPKPPGPPPVTATTISATFNHLHHLPLTQARRLSRDREEK